MFFFENIAFSYNIDKTRARNYQQKFYTKIRQPRIFLETPLLLINKLEAFEVDPNSVVIKLF